MDTHALTLYGYYRSSAAYRLRIALNLKGIEYRQKPVNLLKREQQQAPYRQINPQGLVPALDIGDDILCQSVAILEWLEENYPTPPLLPAQAATRAKVRGWVNAICCDIHPLNNLRVLDYLKGELQANDTAKTDWYHHWIQEGFTALEPQLAATPYCLGEPLSLADACLIPQVYNALRFNVDMAEYPKIRAIYEACQQLSAFQGAAPEQQPDAS